MTCLSKIISADFYKDTAEYIKSVPLDTVKNIPNISDRDMFIESCKLFIEWGVDVENGYELEFNNNYTKFRKRKIQWN